LSAACFVYVLGCSDRHGIRTYVGWTNDMAGRLRRHNAGKGARSTRGREWLVLYAERLPSKQEAMSREYYLKRDRRFRKKLMQAMSLLSFTAERVETLRIVVPAKRAKRARAGTHNHPPRDS
jgi:putative endonuclease